MTLQRFRLTLPWLLIVLVGVVAALLRFDFIEPSEMAHLCGDSASPRWCTWRQWMVLGFLGYGYGYAALVAAALSLVWRYRPIAWLAAALGLAALVLYCADAGAFALLVGSLRLLRGQVAGLPPAGEHRHGQREIQPQP